MPAFFSFARVLPVIASLCLSLSAWAAATLEIAYPRAGEVVPIGRQVELVFRVRGLDAGQTVDRVEYRLSSGDPAGPQNHAAACTNGQIQVQGTFVQARGGWRFDETGANRWPAGPVTIAAEVFISPTVSVAMATRTITLAPRDSTHRIVQLPLPSGDWRTNDVTSMRLSPNGGYACGQIEGDEGRCIPLRWITGPLEAVAGIPMPTEVAGRPYRGALACAVNDAGQVLGLCWGDPAEGVPVFDIYAWYWDGSADPARVVDVGGPVLVLAGHDPATGGGLPTAMAIAEPIATGTRLAFQVGTESTPEPWLVTWTGTAFTGGSILASLPTGATRATNQAIVASTTLTVMGGGAAGATDASAFAWYGEQVEGGQLATINLMGTGLPPHIMVAGPYVSVIRRAGELALGSSNGSVIGRRSGGTWTWTVVSGAEGYGVDLAGFVASDFTGHGRLVASGDDVSTAVLNWQGRGTAPVAWYVRPDGALNVGGVAGMAADGRLLGSGYDQNVGRQRPCLVVPEDSRPQIAPIMDRNMLVGVDVTVDVVVAPADASLTAVGPAGMTASIGSPDASGHATLIIRAAGAVTGTVIVTAAKGAQTTAAGFQVSAAVGGGASTVALAVAPTTIAEGESSILTVTRSGDLSQGVTIPVLITGGSAEVGDVTTSIPVTQGALLIPFTAGQDSATVTIAAVVDGLAEMSQSLPFAFGQLPAGVTAAVQPAVSLEIQDQGVVPAPSAWMNLIRRRFGAGSVDGFATCDAGVTAPTGRTIVSATLTWPGAGARSVALSERDDDTWGADGRELFGARLAPRLEVNGLFPTGTYTFSVRYDNGQTATATIEHRIATWPQFPVVTGPTDLAILGSGTPTIAWTGERPEWIAVSEVRGITEHDRILHQSITDPVATSAVLEQALDNKRVYEIEVVEAGAAASILRSSTILRVLAPTGSASNYQPAAGIHRPALVNTDAAGNRFLVGRFRSQGRDLDPTAGQWLQQGGLGSIFATRLDADGVCAWTQVIGGAGTDAGVVLAGRTEGFASVLVGSRLYILGICEGADLTIGGAGLPVSSIGRRMALVMALDAATGAPITGFGTGGLRPLAVGMDVVDVGSICAGPDGSIFISGTALMPHGWLDTDAWIARLDANGTPVAGFGNAGVALVANSPQCERATFGLAYDAGASRVLVSVVAGLGDLDGDGDGIPETRCLGAVVGADPATGGLDARWDGDGRLVLSAAALLDVGGLAVLPGGEVAIAGVFGGDLMVGTDTTDSVAAQGASDAFLSIRRTDGSRVTAMSQPLRLGSGGDDDPRAEVGARVQLIGGTLIVSTACADAAGNREGAFYAVSPLTGQPVTAFGSQGLVRATGGGPDEAWLVAPLPDGRMLLSGQTESASLMVSDVAIASTGVVGSYGEGFFVAVDATTGLSHATPSAPVITEQPVALTRSAGQSASFTVAATGVPEPQYQWYRATSATAPVEPIQGATQATYTIQTVAMADNGRHFECKVWNDQGQATTSRVGLTVVLSANPPPAIGQGATASIQTTEDGPAATLALTGADDGPAAELQWSVSAQGSLGLATVSPAAGAATTVSYQPAADASGTDYVTVCLTDGQGATDTIQIRVTIDPVNDPPSFVRGMDQTVDEDAGPRNVAGWATLISAGPGETGPVSFVVTNDNQALFSGQPAISSIGDLTFTPAADASGVAHCTVTLLDAANATCQRELTIQVRAVNDPPSASVRAIPSLLEDAAQVTLTDFVTLVAPGPNESGNVAIAIAAVSRPELLAGPPYIGALNELVYAPAPDAYGTCDLTIRLTDDGTPAGITDIVRTIVIHPVNDAPSFAKGADVAVAHDAGARSLAGWATAIATGPGETGQSLAFTVLADDPTLFAVPPAIAVDGTLTFTPQVGASGGTLVTVRLRDDGGTADGGRDLSDPQTFTITVARPPVITGQPADASVAVGGTASFTVVSDATSFQWQRLVAGNWEDIAGATAATFSLAAGEGDNGALFRCRVARDGVVRASQAVRLTVTGLPPAITAQPAAQSAALDAVVTFRVAVSGTAPFSFRWQRAEAVGGFADIVGATQPTLTFRVGLADRDDRFRCVIGNGLGSATSDAAALTVTGLSAPDITTDPAASTTVELGGSVRLTVVASGAPAPTFVWEASADGDAWTVVDEAILATLEVRPAAVGAMRYRCRAGNAIGVHVSEIAEVVAVAQPPRILDQPVAAQMAIAGSPVTLRVRASGLPVPAFQWERAEAGGGFAAIPGATAAELTFAATAADDGDRFRCVATNGGGSATSDEAVVAVRPAPVAPEVATQPTIAGAVGIGAMVELTAAFSGTPTPSCQWRRNGVALAGETFPTLRFVASYADDGAVYVCVGTNRAGSASTAPVVLDVLPQPPAITSQPTGVSTAAGRPFTLGVTATGIPAPTCQWYRNGAAIAGATAATYTVERPALADAGVYRCVVANAGAMVDSQDAVVTVVLNAFPVTGRIIDIVTELEVPTTPACWGLSAGDLLRFDGAAYQPIGADEVLPAGGAFFLAGAALPSLRADLALVAFGEPPPVQLAADTWTPVTPIDGRIDIDGTPRDPIALVNDPTTDVVIWYVDPVTGASVMIGDPDEIFGASDAPVPAGATLWVISDAPNGGAGNG